METATNTESNDKYLTFQLSSEVYGLEILRVVEIISTVRITTVPRAPRYLKGIINLRGQIIPVIDLREKLGLTAAPYDEKTCIIVTRWKPADDEMLVGVIVDTVVEVLNLTGESICTPPQYGVSVDTNSIVGMGRTPDNHIVILLDMDRVLAGDTHRILKSLEQIN